MNLPRLSLIILLCFSGLTVFGQKSNYNLKRKNTVEITSAGLGLHISGSYGRVIKEYPNGFITASGGFGRTFGKSGYSIPLMGSVNFGGKDKFVEAGLGGTFWRGTISDTKVGNYHLSPILGYRQIFYNHYYMRLTFNPLFRIAGDPFIGKKRFVPYFGGSFGYTFNVDLTNPFKGKFKRKEKEPKPQAEGAESDIDLEDDHEDHRFPRNR